MNYGTTFVWTPQKKREFRSIFPPRAIVLPMNNQKNSFISELIAVWKLSPWKHSHQRSNWDTTRRVSQIPSTWTVKLNPGTLISHIKERHKKCLQQLNFFLLFASSRVFHISLLINFNKHKNSINDLSFYRLPEHRVFYAASRAIPPLAFMFVGSMCAANVGA